MEEIRLAIVNKLSLSFPDYPVYDEQVADGSHAPYFMVDEVSSGQKKVGQRRLIRSSDYTLQFFPGLLNPRSQIQIMNEWCYEHLSSIGLAGNQYEGLNPHAEIVDKVLKFFISFDIPLLLPKVLDTKMEKMIQEDVIK